jgi:hypothetical protein
MGLKLKYKFKPSCQSVVGGGGGSGIFSCNFFNSVSAHYIYRAECQFYMFMKEMQYILLLATALGIL